MTSPRSRWVWLGPALLAAFIRVPIAAMAEDQFGDAPIRVDLVHRWLQSPGLWWDFGHVFQYGPLPTNVAGLLAWTGLGPDLAPRMLVVIAGIVSVALASILAERLGGVAAGVAAGLALALSPLHIQASTTFASETIYLAFALGCVLRALDRDVYGSAALAFGAATTRFDTWLWLPLLGFWWVWRGFPQDRRRGLLAAALLGVGPLSMLLANAIMVEDPFAALHYISSQHVELAHTAQQLWAPPRWREEMLRFWPEAIVTILTPGFGLLVFVGLWQHLRKRSDALLPLALGIAPPLVYAFKALAMDAFWPMPRFALGPAVMLAVGLPRLRWPVIAVCAAVSVYCDVWLTRLPEGDPGDRLYSAEMSPVSKLPADLRAGSKALREVNGTVALDFVPTYEDILVAYGAGLDRYKLLHPEPGSVPNRIVAIAGGAWDTQLRANAQAFGHRYRRTGEQGRVSWWDLDDG